MDPPNSRPHQGVLDSIFLTIRRTNASLRTLPTTASPHDIAHALSMLPESIPEAGMGAGETIQFLTNVLSRSFLPGQSGPRYFGFVTGGALPAAQFADFLTTLYDQNVQVHLPEETITTNLEARTLELILDLLSIPREVFNGRSLTTGATTSNILALACARDHQISRRLPPDYSVAEYGLASTPKICVFTDRHHASIEKAAAVVGIGRANVISLPPKGFVDELKERLTRCEEKGEGAVVVLSFGEVNTGEFTPDVKPIRRLCDQFGAWLHIDAAFGALACLLPEYRFLSEEMALADSLTSDGHKWFNVPYASGIFYTRSLALLKSVFGPSPRYPPPAYLTPIHVGAPTEPSTSSPDVVPSPLHTNLENSRRFIALPLFAALLSLGRRGYTELVERNVRFARGVAMWMNDDERGGRWYEVLNLTHEGKYGRKTIPLNVVLFRARTGAAPSAYLRPSHGSMLLCKAINATRKMYTSPTVYQGVAAVRIAVSNWGTEIPPDEEVGDGVCQEDTIWDTQELKGMTDYEIVCKTLTTVMVDPPGFVREF